jgi:hypothetical protein
MPITNQTAMIIATNDDETVWPEAGGPDANGKWCGYIMFGEHHRILVSSNPIYDSAEAAKAEMKGVIDHCREHFAEGVA